MTTTPELALDVQQMIEARPETVFRALTEPDLYARWFGPPGSAVTADEMDLRLGGRLGLQIHIPTVDMTVGIEGFYEVIEPSRLLVHTRGSMDEDLVTTVRFELEPQGMSTRLTVHHKGFVDPVDLEQNDGGWRDLLASLADLGRALEEP